MDIKGATILSERLEPYAWVDQPRADVDASALPIYRWCGITPASRPAAVAVPVARRSGGGTRGRIRNATALAGRLVLFRG